MIKANFIKSSIIINPFEDRVITHAFHDIDGTHSLIRDWPPVMSIVLHDVIENGLNEGYDSKENITRLINAAGTKVLEETDRFCVESAGLSALTQMEWAIRRAVEEKTVIVNHKEKTNKEIIALIWQGIEVFDDFSETKEMKQMLINNTPRLFKFYEQVLNGFCRDKNLELAKINPQDFRIEGSFKFLQYLKDNKVKNYFVTGAVVEKGMGMFEEVETLGYSIGPGKLIEDIIGSTWTDKVPKNVIMNDLVKKLSIDPRAVLVVGDGRAEISAGVEMDAITMSRLSSSMTYQQKLHKELGSNILVEDFLDEQIYHIFQALV